MGQQSKAKAERRAGRDALVERAQRLQLRNVRLEKEAEQLGGTIEALEAGAKTSLAKIAELEGELAQRSDMLGDLERQMQSLLEQAQREGKEEAVERALDEVAS